MPQTLRDNRPSASAVAAGVAITGDAPGEDPARERQRRQEPVSEARGFGGGSGKSQKRKGGRKRSPALSKGDWGPLGKHPDIEAIVAHQRLHLPLSGRLHVSQVNQAWKLCAAEHHPDRGGVHDTMQLVNGARDLLLGRDNS